MDPETIEEFREILMRTTFPPVEVVTARSIKSEFEASFKDKLDDEHIRTFIDRVNNMDNSLEQFSVDIKLLKDQIEQIGYDKSSSENLEKVEQEDIQLDRTSDRLNLTASSVDRMDNKVDRHDIKVDRYDTKVDNLERKIQDFSKQVITYEERLEEVNQSMEELKKEIENLERDL
ncbi:hypothetical protein L486_03257 [Kwoniella mangroviensis CBS 10435]|uniref:Uncharacterized protein n=1 Tax=Kwoniella mangroviensis CBS 10435 TaxID=1331196 RepID=A0A1B9ITB8_9TREE|nr:uncharacterized protein I203_01939 [Kwoniella mangroviensis CBS 8507]OCF58767.1 hypothetical protein L486_03257 [Kwoniella mangroviensis CBS 10435]OCF68556.1 hypothetical protein I203_01939 [Kwoniella mangroviensis CBS 8507]